MNVVKIILVAVAVFLAAMLAFSVIGIIYSALWYLFLLGVAVVGGFVGYKFLKKTAAPQLEDKQPVSIKEMDDAARTLEEYKRKYLPK